MTWFNSRNIYRACGTVASVLSTRSRQVYYNNSKIELESNNYEFDKTTKTTVIYEENKNEKTTITIKKKFDECTTTIYQNKRELIDNMNMCLDTGCQPVDLFEKKVDDIENLSNNIIDYYTLQETRVK